MPGILWRSCDDKKMRVKLMIAAMVSLLLVLLVIEGAVRFLNYRKMVRDTNYFSGLQTAAGFFSEPGF